jgi:hypothetical protein
VAIGVGLVTLLSFFIDNATLATARLALTDWVVILAGLALLVGMLHLLLVHLRKVQAGTKGWPYSVLVVLSAIFVLILGLLEGPQAASQSTSLTQVAFNGVLVATQASLAGLVVFFLVYAAARMFSKRRSLSSLGFLVVVLIILLGWLPLSLVRDSLLPGLRDWLLQVPTTAGARGILLGVALGSVMVGLRVLVGAEWPYRK